jgi:hypothetical protein
MRSLTAWSLIGCVLFVTVSSPAYEPAGTCREAHCGRSERPESRPSQDRSKQQDTKRSTDNSGTKDQSPCGPNPPDKGFVYKNQRGNGTVHADPAADSDVVGTPPNGSRLMYDQVSESGGRRWYHVNPPGGRAGWLPASDVSCERPTAPPPPKPDRVMDCDIPLANTSSAQGGARGFAAGSACDEYERQNPPVSFR